MTSVSIKYHEQPVTFGKDKILTGITSLPADNLLKKKTAILFFNAGVLHRVGPQRMYVTLARFFAELGFLSLRFDLSGLGDSLQRRGTETEEERALKDIQEAMTYLEESQSISSFILIGLCSGADQVLEATYIDQRVRAAVLLDGVGYRTALYYFYFYLRRIFNLARLFSYAQRFLQKLLQKGAVGIPDVYEREVATAAETQNKIVTITKRGSNMLFVYTGGVEEYYAYRNQFYDFFPGLKNNKLIKVEYIQEADHTFSFEYHRTQLRNLLDEWLREIDCS